MKFTCRVRDAQADYSGIGFLDFTRQPHRFSELCHNRYGKYKGD